MMQAGSLLDAFLEPVTAGSKMAMLLLGHVLRGDNLVAAVAGVLFAGYDFAHNKGRAPSDKEAKCFATSALLVVVLLFGLIGLYLVSIFAAHAIINFLLNVRAMLLTLTVVAVLMRRVARRGLSTSPPEDLGCCSYPMRECRRCQTRVFGSCVPQ